MLKKYFWGKLRYNQDIAGYNVRRPNVRSTNKHLCQLSRICVMKPLYSFVYILEKHCIIHLLISS